MGAGSPDDTHRARLFPLPALAAVACRSGISSQRARHRLRLRRTVVAVTNRAICTLNRLYTAPSIHPLSTFPFNKPSQPDKTFSCFCCRPSDHSSAAQLRVLSHLRERCAAFVLTARTWDIHHLPTDVIGPKLLDMLESTYSAAGGQPRPPTSTAPSQDSLSLGGCTVTSSSSSSSLPAFSAFSSAPTAVVPLIADRISLPEQLHIVSVLSVLPPEIATQYSAAQHTTLLRSSTAVVTMNFLDLLPQPRVAGARKEYLRLIDRMRALGMSAMTATPKAVNGVFAVAKDEPTDRVIIDARFANRLFVDSPHVALPGPSHLVQLVIPAGAVMQSAKSDLSNYYHHLGVPEWLQPYLALPPLTPAELAERGLPLDAAFPMCLTMPMGFSHAVYLAQTAHEFILYRHGLLRKEDNLLLLRSPLVSLTRVIHGIVIDDFFSFCLCQKLADRTLQLVLDAYAAAGFVVKQSKVVRPTSAPVKIIGFDIDGARGEIALPADSQLSLLRSTLALLRQPTVTGSQLSHIIGRWTWVMMLRRSSESLAVLQHCYRYCRQAQFRRFTLWPTVRRELCMLVSLLPLLYADLRAPFFHRAIASDASELAGGVVSTPLSPTLSGQLWPLCSSRHHAVQQTRCNAERMRSAEPLSSEFDDFYSTVSSTPWRTLISKPWEGVEHINALELRAALLSVHWVLSYPSSLNRRVYLLLDSTVAFFSLWKGRSSSPALLLVLRKISALLLASGLSLLPGWVPSAVNPADAPSRLIDPCPRGRATL